MKRALLIAFHYPPMRGSSGLQRTLTFGNELLDLGWQTTVLTVHPRAYPDSAEDQLADIDPRVRVVRAQCWDAARHLSAFGRYPRWLAMPDRWASWYWPALWAARREIRRARPDVIWSTHPICTAQRIGAALHRATGIPWVADLRDSMTEENYPTDPAVRAAFRRVEAALAHEATAVVFTAPSTERMYRQRYPNAASQNWCVIGNGYDEGKFQLAAAAPAQPLSGKPQRWVHAGLLDPSDRDPTAFFAALTRMRQTGRINAQTLQVVLRATGHDDHYRSVIAAANLAEIVCLEPPIPYREALAEMLGANALLIFQAANCNHQIPAKLYEYIRAQRPILCLTDPNGDTAAEARAAGVGTLADLHDSEAIGRFLERFLTGELPAKSLTAAPAAVTRYSRRGQAQLLAELFARVVPLRTAAP
jgi:hypothetical protein